MQVPRHIFPSFSFQFYVLLFLQDEYDNPCGQTINGKVAMEIVSESTVKELPQLVGNSKKIELPMSKGQALIQVRLAS